MDTQLLPLVGNLGVAGFAIYVMWRMSESNNKEREKHLDNARMEREKFMSEINEAGKTHNLFQEKVRTEIMEQLNQNTSAFQRVLDHYK